MCFTTAFTASSSAILAFTWPVHVVVTACSWGDRSVCLTAHSMLRGHVCGGGWGPVELGQRTHSEHHWEEALNTRRNTRAVTPGGPKTLGAQGGRAAHSPSPVTASGMSLFFFL